MSTSAVSHQLNSEEITAIVFNLIIYAVGVVGNLLVIFVIFYQKDYKKTTRWYVLQLAFADIIFLHNIPFGAQESILNRWIHTPQMCSAQQTILFFTYYASIMFLVIIAVDRYLAVCHPLSSFVQKLRQNKIAYLTALVTWIVALLMSIPVMMYSQPVGVQPHCRCRILFPLDETVFCTSQGFTASNINICRQFVVPDVRNSICVDPIVPIIPDIFIPPLPLPNVNLSLVPVTGLNNTLTTGGFIPFFPTVPRNNFTNSAALTPVGAILPNFTTVTDSLPGIPAIGGINSTVNEGVFPGVLATNPAVPTNPLPVATTGFPSLPRPPIIFSGGSSTGTGGFLPLPPTFVSGGSSTGTGGSLPLPPPFNSGSSSAGTGISFPTPPSFNFGGSSAGTGVIVPQPPPSPGQNSRVLSTQCHYDTSRPGWKTFILVNFVLMFVIPLIIISICYGLIIRQLMQSTISKSSDTEAQSTTGKLEREKRKVTLLCVLLTILFTIFWLPFHSVHLARLNGITSGDATFCNRLSSASIILAFLSSATNPYLYNFLGSFVKRLKPDKESKRTQPIVSATGVTRASAVSSSAL